MHNSTSSTSSGDDTGAATASGRIASFRRIGCPVCTLGIMAPPDGAPEAEAMLRIPPAMASRALRPSEAQLAWMDREVGAMVSWNLQTLCGNGPGYDPRQPCQAGEQSPSVAMALQWNPSQLDLDAMMVAAKSFGAKYMVWTAQHMSGFSLWDSKVRGWVGGTTEQRTGQREKKGASTHARPTPQPPTPTPTPTQVDNFTLTNTPWRGGGVDFMAEYVKTAAKHGVAAGVFYSAHYNWYYGVVGFTTGHYAMSGLNYTQEQYNELVSKPQVAELFRNYGNLSEVWFDGGLRSAINSQPGQVVQSLSPRPVCHSCDNCSQSAQDPSVGYGIRWVGNEEGNTPEPNWLTTNNPSQGPGRPDGIFFAPPSCDTVLREHFWFWKNNTEGKLRSVATLVNVYLSSVGKGCNLILNMAPDPTGHLPDIDARQYQAMGQAVDCLFAQVTHNTSTFASSGGATPALTWAVPSQPASAQVSLALWEDLTQGQLINMWSLQARGGSKGAGGDWVQLAAGQTITHKRILHNMTLPASVLPLDSFRFVVDSSFAQADQTPTLRRAELFDMTGRAQCVE